jgi:hypothetical protein
LAVTIVALGCAPFLVESADAANCAPLEMRLMQLQSRQNPNAAEMQEARSLLAQCNGTQTASALPWGNKPIVERSQRGPNTVRTLCVRTCDGYYFPISFSTTRKYLEADEAACQRMCPAGDASLYYHSRREGPEQMVSIAGTPYTDLENAFRYRTVLDRSCTCGTPLPISEPAEIVLADYSDEPSVSLEDSETLANLAGEPVFTASVAAISLAEPSIGPPSSTIPQSLRVILSTGNEEQDLLLASSVPGKWFQKEPDAVYLRGPGGVACMNRGPDCQPQ